MASHIIGNAAVKGQSEKNEDEKERRTGETSLLPKRPATEIGKKNGTFYSSASSSPPFSAGQKRKREGGRMGVSLCKIDPPPLSFFFGVLWRWVGRTVAPSPYPPAFLVACMVAWSEREETVASPSLSPSLSPFFVFPFLALSPSSLLLLLSLLSFLLRPVGPSPSLPTLVAPISA